MTPDEERAFDASKELAKTIIMAAEIGDMQTVTDATYEAWIEEPILIPMAMVLWFTWAVDTQGTEPVSRIVKAMTTQVAKAPVERTRSRMVFCDVMYAMQDDNIPRLRTVWETLRDDEDWETAEEVVALVLSFVGFFLGWFDEEGRLKGER